MKNKFLSYLEKKLIVRKYVKIPIFYCINYILYNKFLKN